MTTLTQPLKWHGGKHYLSKRIIELMPPHLHYVEPFFGGGSVLLQKPAELIEGHSEVVNDIDGELTVFWRVLKSDSTFESFCRRIEAIPFSQGEFNERLMYDRCVNGDHSASPPVWRAVAFFVRYRQSRQGLGKDFATLSRNRTRRGMNEQVSSWLTAIEGLPEIHERLKRVVILNDDACKVIKQQDGENTLFYCDPPYLHETRSSTWEYGEHEMSEDDHVALLDTLYDIKGKFILSGYPSDTYDFACLQNGWRYEEIQIDNKASSKKTKEKKTECLWMNYESA